MQNQIYKQLPYKNDQCITGAFSALGIFRIQANSGKKDKSPTSSRNKALKCRGGEIRTPDLLLPKEESLWSILVDK